MGRVQIRGLRRLEKLQAGSQRVGPNPSLAVLSHLPALEETPVRAVPFLPKLA